jgi:tetratricopeptide (TPR) repeat protein
MARIFCLSFLFLFSLFGDWDEDDDWFESESEPDGTLRPISYGGITIECDQGCGDPEFDPNAIRILELLQETVRGTLRLCSPLRLSSNPLAEGFYHAWECDEDSCEIYNWPATHGLYSPDEPLEFYSVATYPQFLELSSMMRRDIQFYYYDKYVLELNLYRSAQKIVREERIRGEYGNVEFDYNGELLFYDWGTSTSRSREIAEFARYLKGEVRELKEKLPSYREYLEEKKELLEKSILAIDAEFRAIFSWCLQNHQPEGIAFHSAIEDFIEHDFDVAIDRIRWVIELSEKHNVSDDLLSKLYFLKGSIQSEFGLYADAVIGLTEAIQKNPSMKEAYLERASAYFELGQFDRSLEDFLTSEFRSHSETHLTQLGLGITAGIIHGAKESCEEFIPSMIGTLRGLGSGLWALTKDPLGASHEFVNAAIQCVEFIKSHSPASILQDMVPELKELIQSSDQLENFQKGKLIGQIIGKYGMDILMAKQGATFIRAYRDLKRANQVMTLEALASGERATILGEAEQRWTRYHLERIKGGEITIDKAKQGKHIVGHPNYENLIKNPEKSPSIFEHPDPNRLLREFGGTGIKKVGDFPGTAGYVEIVDFGEFIGYAVEKETRIRTATTLGKVHYAKDGAHIVPYTKK